LQGGWNVPDDWLDTEDIDWLAHAILLWSDENALDTFHVGPVNIIDEAPRPMLKKDSFPSMRKIAEEDAAQSVAMLERNWPGLERFVHGRLRQPLWDAMRSLAMSLNENCAMHSKLPQRLSFLTLANAALASLSEPLLTNDITFTVESIRLGQ